MPTTLLFADAQDWYSAHFQNRQPAETAEQWFANGRAAVEAAKQAPAKPRKAKNIILFIGDGMSASTVTAARILEGQLRGQPGEENFLSFEKLPHLALAKTYNTNQQTPDSAGTMSAIVTGVKTKAGVLSIAPQVAKGDHVEGAANQLTTFLELAEDHGLSSGVVSSARLTHATPAACYAHSPDRGWEDDSKLPAAAAADQFPDIARQLLECRAGNGLEVALGGGRSHFLPENVPDPEDTGKFGAREDQRNLTEEWVKSGPDSHYVWNKEQFDAIDPQHTKRLLGLFERSHMEFEYDRPKDAAGEPSLTEMTRKAIAILQQNPKGFFLMVEGGRIDHAHHGGNAFRALRETIEMANAVEAALEITDPSDTLVLVTADHSHVFTMAGYPTRGNPILGKVRSNNSRGVPSGKLATDSLGLPYTTLGYANGPGFHESAGRPDLTDIDTTKPDFRQEAAVPTGSETHGADDVPVYAGGAGAHLVRGVMEQNVLFHVMLEASGLSADGLPFRKK